jgi:hypothetical protein
MEIERDVDAGERGDENRDELCRGGKVERREFVSLDGYAAEFRPVDLDPTYEKSEHRVRQERAHARIRFREILNLRLPMFDLERSQIMNRFSPPPL